MKAITSIRKGILILSIFSCINLYSQAPAIEWQNTIGASLDDRMENFAATPDGGFILAGQSGSGVSGDKSEPNWGSPVTFDYWLIKTNAAGAVEWENTIGGTQDDQLMDIDVTNDGGYILAGYSGSPVSGDKTVASLNTDYWIIKINAAGIIEWQTALGGTDGDICKQIRQTADGGYIAAGWSYSGISGEKTSASKGSSDYWIVKLDNSGNVLWDKSYGGNSADELYACEQTSDGGYILGGYSTSGISGDKTEIKLGSGGDYWMIKTDASGNMIWQNTIGGNGSEKLTTLITTTDAGYLLGGYSNSDISYDKTSGAYGAHSDDYWLVKINSAGTVLWDKVYGGANGDYLYGITTLSDGNYLLSGVSYSESTGNKSEANMDNFYRDIWLLKTDATGTILWQDDIWANMDEQHCSAVTTADGGFAVGGYSTSGTGGDKTEASHGSWDIWLIKFAGAMTCDAPEGIFSDNITSTSAKIHWSAVPAATKYQINYRPTAGGSWMKKNSTMTSKNLIGLSPNTTYEYKIKTICATGMSPFSALNNFTTLPLRENAGNESVASIYLMPNPAVDRIELEIENFATDDLLNTSTQCLILILNTTGQMVHTEKQEMLNGSLNTQVDISHLPAGMYCVHVIGNGKMVTENFIKN